MSEVLIDKLLQLMPLWTIIIIGIMFVAMKFYYTRFAKLEEKVEDSASSLSKLDDVPQKARNLEEQAKGLDNRLCRAEDTLASVTKWIIKQDKAMIDEFMQKRSPYTLTSVGEQLLRDSGANQVLEQCMPQYIADLEAKEPKTAYDVEDLAYDVLFRRSGDDAFKPIKDYLYLAPDPVTFYSAERRESVEVRVSLIAIIKVMSLPLRDEYLRLHPELNPEE